MEGRLHLSNVVDEDPTLQRPDRGRTLSNHATDRRAASQSAKRSLIPLGLFLSDQLTHCHSLSNTHTRARSVHSKTAGTYTSALFLSRARARSLNLFSFLTGGTRICLRFCTVQDEQER